VKRTHGSIRATISARSSGKVLLAVHQLGENFDVARVQIFGVDLRRDPEQLAQALHLADRGAVARHARLARRGHGRPCDMVASVPVVTDAAHPARNLITYECQRRWPGVDHPSVEVRLGRLRTD
jgi:hypothetical protein